MFFAVPLVRIWLSLFRIKFDALFPSILFFSCIGTFSINGNVHDIYATAFFGVLGYIFLQLKLEPAPLLLGFILGPMLEENFRRTMLVSRGSFSVFVHKPISAALLALIALFFIWQLIGFYRNRRNSVTGNDAPSSANPLLDSVV